MAVLTISRQFGAGGKTLGELVAKRLGYPCINEQLIKMIADKARVSTNWVESIEKEAGGTLLKFMTTMISKSFIDRILGDSSGYIDENVYIETLSDIINRLAGEGNCIIVGRGGQYILKGRSNVFHVLLVASKEDRHKFMEKNYDLLPTQAKQVVKTQDKRRETLYRRFGTEGYDNPDHYNLVLNMSMINMEKAVNVVCKMFDAR